MTTLKKKNNNENLLKAISFLRLNLTYDELGEKLGYKKATISKYIKGTLPPSSDFLSKFEEVFKVELNSFENKEIKKPTTDNSEWASLKAFNEHLLKENEFLKAMLLKK